MARYWRSAKLEIGICVLTELWLDGRAVRCGIPLEERGARGCMLPLRSGGSMGAQLRALLPWREDAGLEDAELDVGTRTGARWRGPWRTIEAVTQAEAGTPHPHSVLGVQSRVASPVLARYTG
ncbi:hypothetical protein DFH09DRAFT_1162562 [Mycena vulgaris]|nr:hypothetical protein DFH09DRAFT_1162562 [Mycena vulgaris]